MPFRREMRNAFLPKRQTLLSFKIRESDLELNDYGWPHGMKSLLCVNLCEMPFILNNQSMFAVCDRKDWKLLNFCRRYEKSICSVAVGELLSGQRSKPSLSLT